MITPRDQSGAQFEESDLFSRPRFSPGCASIWRMSRATLGLLSPEAQRAFDAHLSTCASCQERWTALAEAQAGPVPEALLIRARDLASEMRAPRPAPRPARARWRAAGASLTALAAAALLSLWLPTPPEETRPKGAIPIRAAVLRRGAREAVELDLERARVSPGDRLRIGVDAPEGSGLRLQGWEDEKWTDYFSGTAKDPWLPVGIEITDQGQTRLRLIVCPTSEDLERLGPSRGPSPTSETLREAGCLERHIDL